MFAILGGLGAALSWAVSTLASARTTRAIGAPSVLAWVMVVGLVVSVPFVAAGGLLVAEPSTWLLLGVVGVAYNAGLLLAYAALTRGRVSIVAPIVATEGAAAAAISVVLGDPMSVPVAVILALIAVGIVLASIERAADKARPDRDPMADRQAVLLAIGSAVVFSIGLVAAARVGGIVPVGWVVVASRTIGTLGIALPLLLTGRLRLTRAAAPFVALSGVLEATGTVSYVLGAQHGVAIAAVLSSQFAALAAVGAFFLFRERLERLQLVGVGIIVLGISALAVVRA